MIPLLEQTFVAFAWPILALTVAVSAVYCTVQGLKVKDPVWIHAAYAAAIVQGLIVAPWAFEIHRPQWLPPIKLASQGTDFHATASDVHAPASQSEMASSVVHQSNKASLGVAPFNSSNADQKALHSAASSAVAAAASHTDHDVRLRPSVAELSSVEASEHEIPLQQEDASTMSSQGDGLLLQSEGSTRSAGMLRTAASHKNAPRSESFLSLSLLAFRTIAAIWLGGVLWGLRRLFLEYKAIHHLLRSCKAAPDSWMQEVITQSSVLGLKSIPDVRYSENAGPLLCPAWKRPVLVLPKNAWPKLPARERKAILAHELGHYVRGDLRWLIVARLATIIHWFNPLAHFAAAKLEEAAEWSCDAWATKTDASSAVHLARALVRFLENGQTYYPLASAVGGASMKSRLVRLVSGSRHNNPQNRWTLMVFIASIAALGALRFRLVEPLHAAEPNMERRDANERTSETTAEQLEGEMTTPDAEAQDPQALFEKNLSQLLDKLVDEGREELLAFKELAQQEAGQTVVRSRMSGIEWQVREDMRKNGVERFFASRFTKEDGKWAVKPEFEEMAKDFVRQAVAYNEDLQGLHSIVSQAAEKLPQETDAEKLMGRVLRSEGFLIKAYLDEVRNILRPGLHKVEEKLGEALAKNNLGEYIIPQASREEVSMRVDRLQEENKELIRFTKELQNWSEELIDKSDQYSELIKAMKTPEFAVFALVQSTSDGNADSVEQQLENFFYQLEENTKEGVEGLEFDFREESQLSDVMEKFNRCKKNAEYVQPLLGQIAAKIRPIDSLHKDLAAVLQSPLSAHRLVRDTELTVGDLEAAAQQILPRVIVVEEGKSRLSEEAAANAQQIAEDLLRGQREFRRRGRKLEDMAATLKDEELGKAMASLGGKLLLASMIQEESEGLVVDSFPLWREDMFEESPQGYLLKEEKLEELSNMIKEMRELQKELAKNDF